MRRSTFVLISIICFAFFLRIFQVNKIPPSLSWDEVSIGYNAYSILKTGRDEHQRFLPFDTFVAYGDYKPPLAIYATVPSVALFGLNEFGVRLPSVIFGTMTVLALFLLTFELFRSYPLSLVAGALLAVSPWHINLSRAGFEANIATFFVLLAFWFVVRAKRNPSLYYICWLPLAFAVYTFNSARYFSPIFALGLVAFSWKGIQEHKKQFLVGIILVFLLLVPIVPHLLSKEARLRFTEVNIFTDSSVIASSNERSALEGNVWWSKIIHNRRIGFARSYLIHFFDEFQPWFLFIRGDGNPKFSTQEVGQLYLIDAPFLLLGIYFLFSKHKKIAWILTLWLIAAIIPAATARETPHALRTENGLPVFIIFTASGIAYGVFGEKKKWAKYLISALIILIYIGSFAYYLHDYYVHYPRQYSGEWQYGYREAINFVNIHQNEYDRIVLTESIGRAYMYALFYTRYDPVKFWQTKKDYFDAAGFYHVDGFDKFSFPAINVKTWQTKTLYILKPEEVPAGAHVLSTINELDGTPVLRIFTL